MKRALIGIGITIAVIVVGIGLWLTLTDFSKYQPDIQEAISLSLIHISEPTRLNSTSRMPSSA